MMICVNRGPFMPNLISLLIDQQFLGNWSPHPSPVETGFWRFSDGFSPITFPRLNPWLSLYLLQCPTERKYPRLETSIYSWHFFTVWRPCSPTAMGFCLPVCKTLRRGKYVLLLFVSLSVLAWIAALSGDTVKSALVFAPSPQTLIKADGLRDRPNTEPPAPDRVETQTPKVECPKESPLLRKYYLKLFWNSSTFFKKVTTWLSRPL